MSQEKRDRSSMDLPTTSNEIIHAEKDPVCQELDEISEMKKEDETAEPRAIAECSCLEKEVWDLIEDYEKKMNVLDTDAALHRLGLEESFHDINQLLKKELYVILNFMEKSEAKVLELLDLSSSITELLNTFKTKNPEKKNVPQIAEKVKVFSAQLNEIENFKSLFINYMSPLQLRDWRGMRHVMKPVPDSLHFDPQSAHPNLILSPNLRQVSFQSNPRQIKERNLCFEPGLYILGLPGFQSGQHYWEVDVGQKSNWIIGVVRGSVERKGAKELSPGNGFWVLSKQNDHKYFGVGSSPLSLKTSPIRIGVCLDFSNGLLAFYDADTTNLIYILSDCSAGEELFAFFSPGVARRVEDWRPMTLCA